MKPELMECPLCEGTGEEETGTVEGGWHETVACSMCDGSGMVDPEADPVPDDIDDDAHLPDCDDPECIACGAVFIESERVLP